MALQTCALLRFSPRKWSLALRFELGAAKGLPKEGIGYKIKSFHDKFFSWDRTGTVFFIFSLYKGLSLGLGLQ